MTTTKVTTCLKKRPMPKSSGKIHGETTTLSGSQGGGQLYPDPFEALLDVALLVSAWVETPT
jgi:hypothetical protein